MRCTTYMRLLIYFRQCGIFGYEGECGFFAVAYVCFVDSMSLLFNCYCSIMAADENQRYPLLESFYDEGHRGKIHEERTEVCIFEGHANFFMCLPSFC